MPMNTVPVASATNDGAHAVVVFQRRCGTALKWIGSCLQIRNAGTQNYNDAYEYCMGLDGNLRRMDIPQASDPTPMQVSARSDAELMQKLYKLWEATRTKDATFNLGVFIRTCLNAGEERNSNQFDRQFWFYDLKGTGRVQFGNDTLVTDNYKQTSLQEDQLEFINGNMTVTSQYVGSTYAQNIPATPTSFPSTGLTQLVVLDSGKAGSVTCGDGRDREGGQILVGAYRTTPKIWSSVDGGLSWLDESSSTAAAADVFAHNGNAFAVAPTNIYVGVPNAAGSSITWTTATTSNAFSGLTNVEVGKDGVLVVAGATGQVWHSYNGGSAWVRVANTVTVTTNTSTAVTFKELENLNGKLFAVGRNTGDTQTVFLRSMDNGLTWILDAYITNAAPAFYEGTAQNWRVVWNLAGTLYQHENGAVSSTTLNPAGITTVQKFYIANPLNCNDVMILAGGDIARSLDGGVTVQNQSVGATLSGAETHMSAAYVSTLQQDYVLVAYGSTLFKLVQNDSFWT
jgi:hypothetical protein